VAFVKISPTAPKAEKIDKPPNMLLTPDQTGTIKSTAQAVLGQGAQITLFGSREDDSPKGVTSTCWSS
jgi:hypothetical protein